MKVSYGRNWLGEWYTDVFDGNRQSRLPGYHTGVAARFFLERLRLASVYNPHPPSPEDDPDPPLGPWTGGTHWKPKLRLV